MELVEALGATYSIDILDAAGTPTSVSELSDSLEIPPATCYRRVNHLASAGRRSVFRPRVGIHAGPSWRW